MTNDKHVLRRLWSAVAFALLGMLSLATPILANAQTTAWSSGAFNIDIPNVVRRSNIVLGAPNVTPYTTMPLGNGSLGAAVWAANGFTAQLNRVDTFPDRKSPGQVTIPGLSVMTNAANFSAHLDLYDGTLYESGGGMTATIYVTTNDELVVDVTGANPNTAQTVQGLLWSGRSPTAAASGSIATMAETWQDTGTAGSGATFGTLLAITAGGRGITASVVNSTTVQLQFTPNADGSFRVVVGAPSWTGGNALTTATSLFGSDATVASATLAAPHLSWWHGGWAGANLLEISSADGSADYLENLRTYYLYQEASSNLGVYPGNQAGVANLFLSLKDAQEWVPADYWFWNMRMQVAANLSSGVSFLNTSYFNLYLNNLSNLQAWTAAHVSGASGICLPEVMRYNGNGYYGTATAGSSCDSSAPVSYNAQTYTSAAEVSLWIWQQYLVTRDSSLLSAGYPFMKASAQFLLSIASLGSDGFLHTTANAHEDQWLVTDPVNDIVAMNALFPVVVSAAQQLGVDATLQSQLNTAIGQLPPLPRTDAATHTQVLTPSADAGGTDVIAYSTQPTAPIHNVENDDLEAVWPYNLIGDNSALTALAVRTYTNRLNVNLADWSLDAVQAARLAMASEVAPDLVALVKRYQVYSNGFASFNGGCCGGPYLELGGNVTMALNEALVQDYDGLLRIAPAWPSSWNGSGTVSIQNNSKVDVQYESGALITVVLEAGATTSQNVRSPWPGQTVQVVDSSTGTTVNSTTATTFTISMVSGHKYLIERASAPFTSLSYAQVSGTPASHPKHLGAAQLGLDPGLSSFYNNVGLTLDSNTNVGNLDGGGASLSQTAFNAFGATPGATSAAFGGVTMTWPISAGTGNPDNVLAAGQTVAMGGSSSTLGFIVAGTYGTATGTGTITYTDGSTQTYSITAPDWWGPPPTGSTVAISTSYLNAPGNVQSSRTVYTYFVSVALNSSKTLLNVQLPNISATATPGVTAMHIFCMGLQ